MLKFILLLIVVYLVMRTVVRILRGGLFFINKGSSTQSERPSSSKRQIEEADYEVIASDLKNKEHDTK
ncbi:hypothetical protein [Pelodictyon phaeoclathratiforme]|jgi:type IV secretory pathway VirB6-like protein|uniref:DUF4834 domain-containing protein n=1 Tax=Pelodictyon phaeoclathratiforme (strain DSM 5477 / BU-1) TaxID=324925 RepID=B4SCE4_PELPB|nr:hypothetical protein [Pelodictyon phaeoclathratiforme]ACF42724.1 conserved hypothetical protein [Pelodictyon phaeoclathratiforme BU-1]MBV5288497.1 hypothetical protein [Pelodictyon phaeoclathratiforme]